MTEFDEFLSDEGMHPFLELADIPLCPDCRKTMVKNRLHDQYSCHHDLEGWNWYPASREYWHYNLKAPENFSRRQQHCLVGVQCRDKAWCKKNDHHLQRLSRV